MSDEVNYQDHCDDESRQCQNCKFYQSHNGKNACVPESMGFAAALEEYGEVSPAATCDNFAAKS